MSLSFYQLSSWQYQKRSNSARLPSKMESWVQLTASCQCVLWFSNSTCLKYCACHEKVRPGHTKCCACHAKSSQQTWRSDAPNFSSVIATGGSAPATLQRQLFDPPELQSIGKTGCFATFLPFARLSLLSSAFLFSDLLSSAFLSSDSCNLCFSICPYCRTFVSEISFDYVLLYIYTHDYYYHHYHNSHSTGHLEGIRCSW